MNALEKRDFRKLLFSTSLPVILQQLLTNSLSFIDTIMIGQLGQTEIAAVGLANQMFFLISVIFFGIASGASIFTSQFWGSRDEKGFQHAAGVSLTLGFALATLFSWASIFSPKALMNIFIDDADVVEVGCSYLRWVGISYLFTSVSFTLSVTIRSTGDMTSPMKATLFSMFFNLAGNYLLIFTAGLGARGAAISTTISRLFEMLILYFLIRKSKVPLSFKGCFSFKRSFVKKYLRTAFPVILDDTLWALGITVYKAVYSRMGIDVLAAANVSESFQDLIFVVQNGMGAAISVLIGNEIGRSHEEKAQEYAKRSLLWTLLVSLVMAVVMGLASPLIPKLFNIDEAVRNIALLAILSMAVTIPVKFNNHVCVTGIVRSGGDTRFMLLTEMFSIWCIGVPMAIIGGLVLHFPLWAVYLMVTCEEISKSLILMPRIFKGKWINNLTGKTE